MNIEEKVSKAKLLKKNKNKTEEQIKAEIETGSLKDTLDIKDLFSDTVEKKLAISLSNKYLADYIIETVSDKNTLKQLIYLETLHIRLSDTLNTFKTEDKIPPPQLIDALHKNVTHITTLKNQLQLIKPKDSKAESGFKYLMDLKKKFEKWREENQGSRTLVCPHCGKLVMLKIKTDKWDAQKHPFFQDRMLTNKHLLKLYELGTITRRDVALVLETSDDYVDFILAKYKING